ncbi:hypothetical protein Scep_001789 [Stephania cephalantha]|uniref:Uncharacterized protein n=1 Tax=Stephania cephalantha TaxID=152367 RepID=A0AAP0Q4B3_9MAGN
MNVLLARDEPDEEPQDSSFGSLGEQSKMLTLDSSTHTLEGSPDLHTIKEIGWLGALRLSSSLITRRHIISHSLRWS